MRTCDIFRRCYLCSPISCHHSAFRGCDEGLKERFYYVFLFMNVTQKQHLVRTQLGCFVLVVQCLHYLYVSLSPALFVLSFLFNDEDTRGHSLLRLRHKLVKLKAQRHSFKAPSFLFILLANSKRAFGPFSSTMFTNNVSRN